MKYVFIHGTRHAEVIQMTILMYTGIYGIPQLCKLGIPKKNGTLMSRDISHCSTGGQCVQRDLCHDIRVNADGW